MQAKAEKLRRSIKMTEELSGVTYVIIIGLGVLTLILLFLFGKRQIMRFALRSRRSPHVPIGYGGPKVGYGKLNNNNQVLFFNFEGPETGN